MTKYYLISISDFDGSVEASIQDMYIVVAKTKAKAWDKYAKRFRLSSENKKDYNITVKTVIR